MSRRSGGGRGKRRAGGSRGADADLERLTGHVARLVSERYTPARLRRGGESLVEAHAMALNELSTTFTSARGELHPGYLDRPRTRAAYLLYYLPVGVATARVALRLSGLDETLRKAAARPLRILDLGAGPLTASLALALLRGSRPMQVVAVDRSAQALRDGEAIMAGLAPDVEVRLERRDLRDRELLKGLGGARFDLVVLGHTLNELRSPSGDRRRRGPPRDDAAAELCVRLLETSVTGGGHLLLYEPGTRSASRRLIAVRETLLSRGLAGVIAPCLGTMTCPLVDDTARSWCHAEQPWIRPSIIQACDRAIGHRRDTIKLSYLALARVEGSGTDVREAGAGGEGPHADEYRIIGGPMHARGRLRRYVCGPKGRMVAEGREAELTEGHWLRQAWRGDMVRLEGTAGAGLDRRGGDLVVRVPPSTGARRLSTRRR